MNLSKINILGWVGICLFVFSILAGMVGEAFQLSLPENAGNDLSSISVSLEIASNFICIVLMVVTLISAYQMDKVGLTKNFFKLNIWYFIFSILTLFFIFFFNFFSGSVDFSILKNKEFAIMSFSVIVLYVFMVVVYTLFGFRIARHLEYAYIVSGNHYFKSASKWYKISAYTIFIFIGFLLWVVAYVIALIALIKYKPNEQLLS